MVASRNGQESLELNASQDGGRVITPARLETRRGRLSRCGFRLERLFLRRLFPPQREVPREMARSLRRS
eukprot:4550892-Prymnesium_polylepis.1